MFIRINFLALRFRLVLLFIAALRFVPKSHRPRVTAIALKALGIHVTKRP